MPLWVDVLDAAGLVLAVVVLYGVGLVVRRRLLSRHGGTFELSHRLGHRLGNRPGDAGRVPPDEAGSLGSGAGNWVLGLGRYSGDDLEWFRIFTLSLRPKRTWRRSKLAYDDVREPDPSDADVLYPDHLVVTCDGPKGPLELAMSRASLTGFQAWLESRTPGSDWSH